LALFLSPIAKFNPRLSKSDFSAAQRAVYVPGTAPLFLEKEPNFALILSILKFFQHHLNHMRRHTRPVTTTCHQWHNAGVTGTFAFQPGPHVTKSNFDNDPSKIEGEWSGLWSFLDPADFDALRNGAPACRRDYLGGPQHWTIRLKQPLKGNDIINIPGEHDLIVIEGEGQDGSSAFTLKGNLGQVFVPKATFGKDMVLYWRVRFVKTYPNDWSPGIWDGVYCPGTYVLLWLQI
jgi:hypothetical protein